MRSFVEQFQVARRVGTPLVAVQTPDPAATISMIGAKVAKATPIVVWDTCRGWQAFNDPGVEAINEALEGADVVSATANAVESLIMASKLPNGSILFVHQAHRLLGDGPVAAAFAQGLWNLRDQFKSSRRTVVLLGPQFRFPSDLANDILLLDEPLPTEGELKVIVEALVKSSEVKLNTEAIQRAVDLLRGLAAFPAEQTVAMSLTKEGLDLEVLGERKRKMIENTPGLSVWSGGDTLDGVGGNAQIKKYVRMIVDGVDSPLCIVFIDEIEKALAGSSGSDSSGVSQGQLEVLLREMQDNGWAGLIFIGPPGAGKSAIAKAIGAEANAPTIACDLNGMKSSLVGSSEERIRTAMKVISAVGGKRVLFVATCNKISSLPPELKRRFTMGTFFFDLPDEEERKVIWKLYLKQYNLAAQKLPDSSQWTGAEIKQACLLAYRLNIPLIDTPQFIVPVAKAAAEDLLNLRKQADNRFLSASKQGLYKMPSTVTKTQPRAVEVQ